MQEPTDTLEAQLAEKEQLVAALTERLEQAAEQLDRLHRTGADRASRSGVMGVPPELIQQHQKLVEDLERAVQQWEDMQPGAFFGRIETQLAEIRDHVVNLDPSAGGHAARSTSHRNDDRCGSGGHDRDEHPEAHRQTGASPTSILDFMKAGLYGGSGADEPATAAAVENPAAEHASTGVEINLPPLQDPPDPIDLAGTSPDKLRSACEARDTYIVYLLGRLKLAASRGHIPNSWAGLENVPGEMRLRLETLEKRLEDTLRLSEVELSLQRAKLSRDESRIRGMDEQAQRELKRVRQSAANQASGETERRGEDSTSGKSGRWKRMLGRKSDKS